MSALLGKPMEGFFMPKATDSSAVGHARSVFVAIGE